jgi:hypothetical protein
MQRPGHPEPGRFSRRLAGRSVYSASGRKSPSSFLSATRCIVSLYAVDEQLYEDSRHQATTKSDPQPERISFYRSQQKYKNAEQAHHGSKKGSYRHSPLPGHVRISEDGRVITGACSLPLTKNRRLRLGLKSTADLGAGFWAGTPSAVSGFGRSTPQTTPLSKELVMVRMSCLSVYDKS